MEANYYKSQMEYMLNKQFIASIFSRLGVETELGQRELDMLMVYIESETKILMKTAIKFMRKDGRTEITTSDIEMAVQDMNHGDLLPLVPAPSSRLTGKSELTLTDVIKGNLLKMKRSRKECTLRGGILYSKERVYGKIAKNKIRMLEKQEINGPVIERQRQNRQFNVLLDKGSENLSEAELIFLQKTEKALAKNRAKQMPVLSGNVKKMFLIMLGLIRKRSNEAGIKLLYGIIKYSYLDLTFLSLHLFPIFEILLVYQGFLSYQIGKIMAKIVAQFRDQRPDLVHIMHKNCKDYSHVLKIIGFEEQLKLSCIYFDLELFLKKLITDSLDGKKIACLCLKTLLEKALSMQSLVCQQIYLPFWIPNPLMKEDPFLSI